MSDDLSLKLTPNVRKLVFQKISKDAIPSGGGLAAAIDAIRNPEKLSALVKPAARWVESAIKAVRLAAEPNPYKAMTDEEIAGVLLAEIQKKRDEVLANLKAK